MEADQEVVAHCLWSIETVALASALPKPIPDTGMRQPAVDAAFADATKLTTGAAANEETPSGQNRGWHH